MLPFDSSPQTPNGQAGHLINWPAALESVRTAERSPMRRFELLPLHFPASA
jgi:hypothetical protein